MTKVKKLKHRNPIAREMRTSLAGLYRQKIEPNRKKVVKKFDSRRVDLSCFATIRNTEQPSIRNTQLRQ